ncbi:hypothetical protein ACN09X_04695 [Aliarcobacter butzleri]|uniref:hypothetical protein n=1 Tax=Aliarcobacter butzleri TaxID=28197 RepID=UPI003AEA19ED
MDKATNKDISEYIGKELNTVKGWSSKFPELYNLVRLGMFCQKNNIKEEDIKDLVEFKAKVTELTKV